MGYIEPNEEEKRIMRSVEFQRWDCNYILNEIRIILFLIGFCLVSALLSIASAIDIPEIPVSPLFALIATVMFPGLYIYHRHRAKIRGNTYKDQRLELWGIRREVE